MTKKAEEQIVKKTIKDSVFTDFFRMPENLLKLYWVLHPEDTSVSESDFKDITVKNVLVDDIYNDLGFRVGDRLIILVEAQSTWTVNIIVRALFYLTTTYQDYINENGMDIYRSTRINIPKPELYVIYTGDRKKRPATITLSEEFFEGATDLAIDVTVKMLYGTDEDDVISQYVNFTKVYDEQRKKYGRVPEAIRETIRICKDRNLLKEYLENRENEVISMMITLFDEEQIMKNHDATLTREITREVTKENQLSSIKNLMETLKLTAQQAMDALKIPESERSMLINQL